MAPKRYKQNGFMCFAREILGNSHEELTLDEACKRAAPIWEEMSSSEKTVYYERARYDPDYSNKYSDSGQRLNSYGTKIAEVEKAKESREAKERNMKREIEATVRNSVNRGDFEKQKYYFIMVNYFTHTKPGNVYVPAELSVSEFSLGDGVTRKYHTFVNPGVDMYGHMHDAKLHARETHALPLPPKAMGEKNLSRIYEDVKKFVGNDTSESIIPVYTHRDAIPIVESVLRFLTVDSPNIDEEQPVFSIQHLLFIMKEAACEIGELPKISVHHITDAYFENDIFEFYAGLSCNYHEELDKSKYCTQSIVTRWGFMFCKYMCSDIAISLVPGRHMPKAVQVTYAVIPGGGDSPSRQNDKKREHDREDDRDNRTNYKKRDYDRDDNRDNWQSYSKKSKRRYDDY